MNIVGIGGGPAGLYFSLLMKQQDPAHEITVIERNGQGDTFGWGVVFSDQTLGNLAAADPSSARAILQSFNHRDDIDIRFKGRTVRSGGHGFCGIGRVRLLAILQQRCLELGVRLVFGVDVADDRHIASQYGEDRPMRHLTGQPHDLPGLRAPHPLAHASRRKMFGKTLADFQLTQAKLAQMAAGA